MLKTKTYMWTGDVRRLGPDDPRAIIVAEDIFCFGRLIGSVSHPYGGGNGEGGFQIAIEGPRFKWSGDYPTRVEAVSALLVRA